MSWMELCGIVRRDRGVDELEVLLLDGWYGMELGYWTRTEQPGLDMDKLRKYEGTATPRTGDAECAESVRRGRLACDEDPGFSHPTTNTRQSASPSRVHLRIAYEECMNLCSSL